MFENTLTTKIEIAAPPAEVRRKFLQFDQIPKYHPNGFFKLVEPDPNAPLEVGTKMHVIIEVGEMTPPVLENTPSTFSWGGRGLMGTFNGNHAFQFTESKTTAGGTTFVQEEEFSGLLAFTIADSAIGSVLGLREKTRKGFEAFNQDLKKWVESGK